MLAPRPGIDEQQRRNCRDASSLAQRRRHKIYTTTIRRCREEMASRSEPRRPLVENRLGALQLMSNGHFAAHFVLERHFGTRRAQTHESDASRPNRQRQFLRRLHSAQLVTRAKYSRQIRQHCHDTVHSRIVETSTTIYRRKTPTGA